jgi:hypothetical protein
MRALNTATAGSTASGGGGTFSDRVRPAMGVGPACGMGYGGGLGPIGGKRAGGIPAVPGDTVGGTGGLGLGLGLGLGEGGSVRSRLRALQSRKVGFWVRGTDGSSKENRGSGKWSRVWHTR